VSLDGHHYKLIGDFEERFANGVPSLREATSFTVKGDHVFGADVRALGAAVVGEDDPREITDGTVIEG
jgi:UTP--glucose-1-phosphate uridylyltransferase